MNQAVEAIHTVPSSQPQSTQTEIADMLRACFHKQRESYLAEPVPDLAQRIERWLGDTAGNCIVFFPSYAYMARVPGWNFVLGVWRWVRSRASS